MADLLSLPLELLVLISSFVSTADLAALRLTCKQVEKSLWEWFTEEFFVKKQFMISQPSLQTLLDISRHVSLSKKLKHLIIATTIYDDVPVRFRDSDACFSYMQGYADQKALLDNGIDREMLTEIFKGLTNLETVDVRDFCAKRERDGTSWASWGATTVLKKTGVPLREAYRGTGSQVRFVSHVFSTLLYAMGVAGRTPPRFEVLFRQQPSGLPDGAFHLANFTFPAVRPVLHNLRTLFLTLNLADVSSQIYHTHSGGTPARAMAGHCLRHFLHCTPNLTHLRLNFQKFQIHVNMEFMKWLATSPTSPPRPPHPTRITSEQPPPVSFPHLRALEFGQLDVDKDILLAVLQRFAPKLKHLSLWRVTIVTNPPRPYDPKTNTWAQFFKGLASVPDLDLTYLKAGALTQNGHNAHFKSEADSQEKSALQREYSGKHMEDFIRGLGDDVVVDWPSPPPSNSDESSSNEDEDISDDDDGNDGEDYE